MRTYASQPIDIDIYFLSFLFLKFFLSFFFRDWVSQSLSFGHAGTVSVFETTIRELGGLLSAFDLSKDNVFLTKAIELGNILAKSFNSHSGIPYSQVNACLLFSFFLSFFLS